MIDSVKLHRSPARLTQAFVYTSSIVVSGLLTLSLGLTPAAAQEPMTQGTASQDAFGRGQPDSLAPPITLFPDQPSEPTDPSGGVGSLSGDAIAVRQLDELSSDTLGLLDGFSGGLPVDMWAGTPKELVDVLLPKLPVRVDSEVMRDLTARLLLSVARPPSPAPVQDIFVDMTAIVPSAVGFSADASSESQTDETAADSSAEPVSDLGILERRVAQLAAMGDWASVEALIELVPDSALSEEIRVLRTDLALVMDRIDGVCADISQDLALSTAAYWQKVFAYCQLRDGNVSGAFLTIDLLRETGVDDPAFFWVAELMSGNRPITPNGLERLTPVQLAMLRTAGRPFPPQLVRNGDPTLLRVLASADPLYVAEEDDPEDVVAERLQAAIELRLDAAERAVAIGALSPDRLRELYRAYEEPGAESGAELEQNETTPADDLQDPQEQLLDLSSIPVASVIDRAKLFQLVEAQTIPTAQAEVISRAIDFARNDRGRNGPDVATMGMVYAPALRQIDPTGDLVWFAGNAARALIAAGQLETGKRWLELSQLYARTSIEASDVAAAMWPVERQLLPSITNRFTPLRFKRWEESRPSTRVAADKALVLSTLTAFGESVSTVDWMSLMDRRTRSSMDMPQPHIWNGLALAAENGRVGETVLLSLIALDEEGPAGASPLLLSRVIESLMIVGLEQDARRLAVEAALAQGL